MRLTYPSDTASQRRMRALKLYPVIALVGFLEPNTAHEGRLLLCSFIRLGRDQIGLRNWGCQSTLLNLHGYFKVSRKRSILALIFHTPHTSHHYLCMIYRKGRSKPFGMQEARQSVPGGEEGPSDIIRQTCLCPVVSIWGAKNSHPAAQSGTDASVGKVSNLTPTQGMRCAGSLDHTPLRLFHQTLKASSILLLLHVFAIPDPHLFLSLLDLSVSSCLSE